MKSKNKIPQLLNNNWFVSSIFFLISLPFITPDSLNLNNIDYVYSVFVEIRTIIILIFAVLLLLVFCYKLIKGVVFRFWNESFVLTFTQGIRLLYILRSRRSKSIQIEDLFGQFNYDSFSYFDMYKDNPWFKRNNFKGLKKLHVIYKTPSRSHLSIPDLIDLRFLKLLITKGVKVSVVILDIPYTTELKKFNSSWSNITKERIKCVLGRSSSVYFLTDLLSQSPHESFKFVCADLIPIYAKGNKFKSQSNTPGDIKIIENISHTGKPLLLIGLNNIISKKDRVSVIQYHLRVKSWDEYYPAFKEKLKIFNHQTCFISVNSLLDPNGNVFKPFVDNYDGFNNFNLTDTYSVIREKLFKKKNNSWAIDTKYITNICKLTFGKQIAPYKLKAKKLKRLLTEEQTQELSISKYNIIDDEHIVCRYILLKEIKRLKSISVFN